MAKKKARQAKTCSDRITGFIKFKDLSPELQKIIEREVNTENLMIPPDSEWKFDLVEAESLPKTDIEKGWELRMRERKQDEPRISRLKQAIIQKGFDCNSPLFFEEVQGKGRIQFGGLHRSVATRELINEKKLPKKFKVPQIVVKGPLYTDPEKCMKLLLYYF